MLFRGTQISGYAMRFFYYLVAVNLILLTHVVAAGENADKGERYDVVLRGGRIVDGSGTPWFTADVAVSKGKIAAIGRISAESASRVIDVRGLIVAPGFIDMMGQTASPMIDDPNSAINLLTQGITTINAGEGGSAAPLGKDQAAKAGYTTMAEYFALLEMNGLPINMVQTVGHTQVRQIVMGDVDRRPSDEELEQMRDLVREGMRAGAIGVSTALIYPPAVYATTREIASLVSVAGEYGGKYYTHMRNEGDQLLEAVDEAIEIGQAGNAPVHIFHLKAAGKNNWGKMQLTLARIRAARSDGYQVTADIYPYVNNGLGIAALIHPRHFAEGHARLKASLSDESLRKEIREEMETTDGWENWFAHAGKNWNRIIVGSSNVDRYKALDGQSIGAVAKANNEDPWETFFNLVQANAFVLPETMSDANKILAIQQDFISFCTDVGPAASGIASHPRAYGAFPRLISRYVRDLGATSLERAVMQASATAANEIMAYDRGRISVGLAADIIVFDYDQMEDKATFAKPSEISQGMKYVFVNGKIVLEDGAYTGAKPGRVLRGPGYLARKAPHQIVDGAGDPRFSSFDELIQEFLEEHRATGVSVAVTNHGKLAFARGYGYADIANNEPVDPTSLFRIASISKPITAVAILQLVERKGLNLDTNVLDVLDLQSEIEKAGESFDVRWQDITVRQLLQHRGGWDRDKSFDAMFQSVRFAQQMNMPPPADQWLVIKAMLSQPLDFPPGERYAYSNFGYCLLGRIIETISEQDYESYVKQHVLAPLGITEMRIGATRLDGRSDHEVRYYHPGTGESVFAADLNQTTPHPYGAWHLEAMDSHGGWIASASDLVRFAAAFDDPENCPILNRQSIELMHQRPGGLAGFDEAGKPKDTYYSFGWQNRVMNTSNEHVSLDHWHTGSLPGTATILIRRHDGKNMVALLNTRVSPSQNHLGRAIDSLLHRAVDRVTNWP